MSPMSKDDFFKDPLALFSVKGKTAIVTGGTGALGAVAAKTLAGAGANIVVTAGIPTTNGIVNITTTNGDRAGDIYNLLTNYNRYPSPQVQSAMVPQTGQFNLWLSEDTPGLAYSVQSRSDLLNSFWQDVPVVGVDADTVWSASVQPISTVGNGFYRIKATPSPAMSPPWP